MLNALTVQKCVDLLGGHFKQTVDVVSASSVNNCVHRRIDRPNARV